MDICSLLSFVCCPITGSLSIIFRQGSLCQVIVNSEKFLCSFESLQELSTQADIHHIQIPYLTKGASVLKKQLLPQC